MTLPLRLSPSGPSEGFGTGDWIEYPATYTTVGLDGVQGDGVCKAQYRFEGKAIRVQCLFIVGTTTVVGASFQNVPLPPGVVIDNDKSLAFSVFGLGVYPITYYAGVVTPNSQNVLSLGAIVVTGLNQAVPLVAGDGYLFDVLLPVL